MLPIIEAHIEIYRRFGNHKWVFTLPGSLFASLMFGAAFLPRYQAVWICEKIFLVWPHLRSAALIFALTPMVLMTANIFLRFEKRKGNAWPHVMMLVFAGLFLFYGLATLMTGVILMYDPTLSVFRSMGWDIPSGCLCYWAMVAIIIVWKRRYKEAEPLLFTGDEMQLFYADTAGTGKPAPRT